MNAPPPIEVADAEWLVGSEARAALGELRRHADEATTASVAKLRKVFTAKQTHLLLEQAELRRRGEQKFTLAERMFFTRVGLQQATDQWVAGYKAKRFVGAAADLCCGIGGDLISLAACGGAVGVDRDPATAVLARANAEAAGVAAEVVVQDAAPGIVREAAAWHADPDRRSTGRRTTRVESYSPDLGTLDRLQAECPNAAIKLAPAAAPPEHWATDRELEWISRRGECRQLVAWSGSLAGTPGSRRATVLVGDEASTFVGSGRVDIDDEVNIADRVGHVICEPDAAVLASGLDGELAAALGLTRLTAAAAYYTADAPPASPLVRSFRVIDELPLRAKTLAKYLQERSVGTLEIKHRGVEIDPDRLRRELRLRGDNAATLIATTLTNSHRKKPVAFLAERLS